MFWRSGVPLNRKKGDQSTGLKFIFKLPRHLYWASVYISLGGRRRTDGDALWVPESYGLDPCTIKGRIEVLHYPTARFIIIFTGLISECGLLCALELKAASRPALTLILL